MMNPRSKKIENKNNLHVFLQLYINEPAHHLEKHFCKFRSDGLSGIGRGDAIGAGGRGPITLKEPALGREVPNELEDSAKDSL